MQIVKIVKKVKKNRMFFFPFWKTSKIWYNEKIKKLGVEDEHSTITLCCGHRE